MWWFKREAGPKTLKFWMERMQSSFSAPVAIGIWPFRTIISNNSNPSWQGAPVSCLHYGVEVPKDKGGEAFLNWMGGYFETHWSVNPHWTAEFKSFPDHPIANGVQPFAVNDEWYFHMRFPEGMKGVTPILSAVAPAKTMERPDGPHSGNPAVREAVAKGLPQHVAWASIGPTEEEGSVSPASTIISTGAIPISEKSFSMPFYGWLKRKSPLGRELLGGRHPHPEQSGREKRSHAFGCPP